MESLLVSRYFQALMVIGFSKVLLGDIIGCCNSYASLLYGIGAGDGISIRLVFSYFKWRLNGGFF